ncbi:MAG TPA: allantoate amidohydrolase [Candidatus Dormibacteraeota bacterium]|nr:allantoate amidohydrolase [Candidatus Dormibacteraeota bacterium]
MSDAYTVLERCEVLAACTDEPGRITRPFASDAMRRCHEHAREWMRGAGMVVERDNIGNLRGRYAGTGSSTMLLGSHLDSVRDAGKYDGPLGVMVAIAAVQRLHDADRRLPFAIEVLAFADEEGLRYGTTYLGSRAVAGQLAPEDLHRTDASGVSLADAIRAFGGDSSRIADDRWSGGDLLGFCEVHIEQGPVLEAHGLPVGVVSSIVGQSRYELVFTGEAGHAGTVPMDRRRDALVAASMAVLDVEDVARSRPGLVATVGQVAVQPGAANVIPGQVTLSLDVRHADDAERRVTAHQLLAGAEQIAENRNIALAVTPISDNPAVYCSSRLIELLSDAAGGDALRLTSGAGHDAVVMSTLTDVGMLFVRCKGGISHNPAESVNAEDVGVAIDVLSRFLDLL